MHPWCHVGIGMAKMVESGSEMLVMKVKISIVKVLLPSY